MKTDERRKAIASFLLSEKKPIPGGVLADLFQVSRQIIVQDITVLRAAGYEILSTHDGYIAQGSPLVQRVFKVYHSKKETEDELSCIVGLGGTVVDVFVCHKVYGRIAASLNISTELQVKQFIEDIRRGKSSELMDITGGYHFHTVCAESEAVLDRISQALRDRKYLIPEL